MNWFQILVFICSICAITLLIGYFFHKEIEGTGPCPQCSQAEKAQTPTMDIQVEESSEEEESSSDEDDL